MCNKDSGYPAEKLANTVELHFANLAIKVAVPFSESREISASNISLHAVRVKSLWARRILLVLTFSSEVAKALKTLIARFKTACTFMLQAKSMKCDDMFRIMVRDACDGQK